MLPHRNCRREGYLNEDFRKQTGVRTEVRINTAFALSTKLLFGLQKSIYAKII